MNNFKDNRNLLTPTSRTIKQSSKELYIKRLYAGFMILVMLIGVFSFFPLIASLTNYVTVTSSGTIISTILPLHVEGSFIKDSSENIITLKGVNGPFDFLDDPWGLLAEGTWNTTQVQLILAAVKTWGFNFIRLHLNVEWWMQNVSQFTANIYNSPYTMPLSYIQCIHYVISVAESKGIYVDIDFYSVQNNTAQDPLPYPPYSLSGSSTYISSASAFVTFWGNVAGNLTNYPNVLFDLWNEPNGNQATEVSWFNTAQLCINEIRSVGATQLIVVEWDYASWLNLNFPPGATAAEQWANNAAGGSSTFVWTQYCNLTDPTGDLVWSMHMYDPFQFSSNSSIAYTAYQMQLGMNDTLGEYGNNTYPFFTKPILIGEIGADSWLTGTRLQEEYSCFDNLLQIYNSLGMSWCVFCWRGTSSGISYGILQNDDPNCNDIYPPNAAGDIVVNDIHSSPFVWSVGNGTYGGTNYIYSSNTASSSSWSSSSTQLTVGYSVAGKTEVRVWWNTTDIYSDVNVSYPNPINSTLYCANSNGTVILASTVYDYTTNLLRLGSTGSGTWTIGYS